MAFVFPKFILECSPTLYLPKHGVPLRGAAILQQLKQLITATRNFKIFLTRMLKPYELTDGLLNLVVGVLGMSLRLWN